MDPGLGFFLFGSVPDPALLAGRIKSNLPGWYKDLAGVQDVYDTRVNKMVEWMDHVEMAIVKEYITLAMYSYRLDLLSGRYRH